MDDFFASFPRFSRVLSNTNELEFARLRAMEGWTRSSSSFRKWYHAFRQAMIKETGSEVDNFFLSRFPSFDYFRLGSPKQQFQRLQLAPVWNRQSGEERKSATSDFMSAYSNDFNRNIDRFFAQYGNTGYNPRNEAKVEFENLRDKKRWHFPKEKTDWEPHHYRLEPEYCKAREGFFTAFIADFKCFFGVGDDVQDWVFLCDILRVSPAPPTVEECRQVRPPPPGGEAMNFH